jgi:hypothetical protein
MIENSIQQFRAKRNASSKRVDTVSATKQRLGLAQRDIARSENETSRLLQRSAEVQEAAYNPEEKISKWADEMDSLRAERVDRDQSTTNALDMNPLASVRPAARWDGEKGMTGGAGGRAGAEEYLGRSMSDVEWEMLARTTYAESTSNPTEQAAVMSVILNRVKAEGYPDTIEGVVNAPNQFQAVTGTEQDPGPSSMYRSFDKSILAKFSSDVTPLLGNFQEQNWLNFTAGNSDAYGPGTNINFRDDVNNSEGSATIGGTIFGTVRN